MIHVNTFSIFSVNMSSMLYVNMLCCGGCGEHVNMIHADIVYAKRMYANMVYANTNEL